MNIVNDKISFLNNYSGRWVSETPKQFLQNLHFFRFIPEDLLDNLLLGHSEIAFPQNHLLFQVLLSFSFLLILLYSTLQAGNPLKYLYIIKRGFGIESSSSKNVQFSDTIGMGCILSYHYLAFCEKQYITSIVFALFLLIFNQISIAVHRCSLFKLTFLKSSNLWHPITKFSSSRLLSPFP